MNKAVGAGVAAFILLIAAAQARGGGGIASALSPAAGPLPATDWSGWRRPLGPAGAPSARPTAEVDLTAEDVAATELDVVDAHWMALTMWGEARAEGEAGMRAVGHVIDNRRRAGMHGAYVTDTVGAAFQFSCWNPGDPNREAMLNVGSLRADEEDGRMWRLAQRLADEILTGRSHDPTGGALFYHAASVAPSWSRGITPVRRIGGHVFFVAANPG
jgi:spore germination cell wall hydrolase CwlJ-like protein